MDCFHWTTGHTFAKVLWCKWDVYRDALLKYCDRRSMGLSWVLRDPATYRAILSAIGSQKCFVLVFRARHNPEPRSEVWWWNLRWSFGGNASDDFCQQNKLEYLLPNFAGSSPPISPKSSPTSLWKSLVLMFYLGIAHVSRDMLQNGVSHWYVCANKAPKGGIELCWGIAGMTEKVSCDRGIAAIRSQYRSKWGH